MRMISILVESCDALAHIIQGHIAREIVLPPQW